MAISAPATYARLSERVAAHWGEFQVLRGQRLRQGERFGKVPEKAAEEIVVDLLTLALDWTVADVNSQVDGADLVVTRLGLKRLIVETKRPGSLSYGSPAFENAREQAHGYAQEQAVATIAVSDGRLFYAEDRAWSADGRSVEPRPRAYFDIDGAPDVASMWWLSQNGIYRDRPPGEWHLCRPSEPVVGAYGLGAVVDASGGADGVVLHPKYKLPAQCFGFVGNPADPATWHLPYLRIDGSIDTARLPKAVQALLTNYRGVLTSSVPEEAVGGVLRKLAQAAHQARRMPGQCPRPAPTYVQLEGALRQRQISLD